MSCTAFLAEMAPSCRCQPTEPIQAPRGMPSKSTKSTRRLGVREPKLKAQLSASSIWPAPGKPGARPVPVPQSRRRRGGGALTWEASRGASLPSSGLRAGRDGDDTLLRKSSVAACGGVSSRALLDDVEDGEVDEGVMDKVVQARLRSSQDKSRGERFRCLSDSWVSQVKKTPPLYKRATLHRFAVLR